MKKARKITIIILFTLSIAMLLTGITVGVTVLSEARLDEDKLSIYRENATVFAVNGTEMPDDRYVTLSDISPHIAHAFIAIEDKRFYSHHGVDLPRVLGAVVTDLKEGRFAQGASTITAQVVKNTHLSNEKTLKRKLQETKIALELEKKHSKEEILEMYLNLLYFGRDVYGVKDACDRIFDKAPSEVTIAEAAALAATVANPKRYSPLLSESENATRRKVVLRAMCEQGYITDEELQRAETAEIIINYDDSCNNYSQNVRKLVLLEAKTLLKNRGLNPDLTHVSIQTYIDPEAQIAAENAIRSMPASTLPDDVKRKLLLADNENGGIVAFAGDGSPFSLPRQQGSTLKPFIYATAAEGGTLTTATQFDDAPSTFSGYAPRNYNDSYLGWISAETALAKSSNVVAVRLANDLGIDAVYNKINDFGIKLEEKDKNLSLALGGTTEGSTLSELAGAYLALANHGKLRRLTLIRSISRNGRTIYKNDESTTRATSPAAAYIITEMLRSAASTGTAKQLAYLNLPIAAKTGTVAKGDGNSDAWIAGYTTKHTFACWIGSETTLPNGVTGGNQPAKTVRSALSALYADEKPSDFTPPLGVRYVSINTEIKERFHAIVPHAAFDVGGSEKVPVADNFRFDSVSESDFYLRDLEISSEKRTLNVRFTPVSEVRYRVFADDKELSPQNGDYSVHCSSDRFIKVKILCEYKDKIIYKKTKLVIPF